MDRSIGERRPGSSGLGLVNPLDVVEVDKHDKHIKQKHSEKDKILMLPSRIESIDSLSN